jgi:hypothetical protein
MRVEDIKPFSVMSGMLKPILEWEPPMRVAGIFR